MKKLTIDLLHNYDTLDLWGIFCNLYYTTTNIKRNRKIDMEQIIDEMKYFAITSLDAELECRLSYDSHHSVRDIEIGKLHFLNKESFVEFKLKYL